MEIRKGIAVSPGIAIAKPMLIDSKDYRIPRRSILPSNRAREIQRLRKAFATAISELEEIGSSQDIKKSNIQDIFAVHMRFLRDR
ncbi:MAG: phosphoenolpyruvate-utilizing N-terminal domain-containing protein, partial [Planctomycetota bacterium]